MNADTRIFKITDPDFPASPAILQRLFDEGRIAPVKCRSCGCLLNPKLGDDLPGQICSSCKQRRPSAAARGKAAAGDGAVQQPARREFTAADKSLIRKVHGYMPVQQLLNILNERLAVDLGPDVQRYTMEQLYAEIGDAAAAVPAGGHDWSSLRKLIAQARNSGVLATISEQVIDDFAVVFSLNPRQVMNLKDIVLSAKGDN